MAAGLILTTIPNNIWSRAMSILDRLRQLFSKTSTVQGSTTLSAATPPMTPSSRPANPDAQLVNKAIYLNAVIELDSAAGKDLNEVKQTLQNIINKGLQAGTPSVNLKGEVKRVRIVPAQGDQPPLA